ncbi:esterase-like activity of phytase family protein [Galbibacter pacificus]|uniref:Esterase-like activity of phytase family protein n=1 Tax=Galbibacter pacificus TaxID=2996052 RepID=A0ABT6FT13_9FLAO|nr:esterase-like activity of phytase family protein [Galbibacter pacificus]MDG3582687.1 esterase-like activity of phytase family protein [Galbibacter pacificus]MDG3586194.1 esterase-like activity of phytase family protein [Galbibacter pacificus]
MIKKFCLYATIAVFAANCTSVKTAANKSTHLKFLDEYIFPNNVLFKGEEIGGLSGIDVYKDSYFFVCDDSKSPRFYTADIVIKNEKIDTVIFKSVSHLKKNNTFVENHFFDLESLLYHPVNNSFILSSEGTIKNKQDPSVIEVDKEGNFIKSYQIPEYFKANSKYKPRHNGLFEGLAISYDKKGFWVGTELPLESDGSEPVFSEKYSPARITYYNWNDTLPKKQFIYQLDKIDKKPKGTFSVNGLTDMLALSTDKMLVLERSYSSGWGKESNGLRIYEIDPLNSTNTLETLNLSEEKIATVPKKLVFDLEDIRLQLKHRSIDNIEGICYGPPLSNGHKTILLISDNNFNTLDPQVNQFLLFEIIN